MENVKTSRHLENQERPPVLGKSTENGFHSSILVPLFFVVLHIACLPHSNEGHIHVLVSELCTRNGVDFLGGQKASFLRTICPFGLLGFQRKLN